MGIEAKELNSYVRHTLNVLESEGIDLEPMLSRLGIDRGALDAQDDQLPQSTYTSLLDEITALERSCHGGRATGTGIDAVCQRQ